MLMTKHLMTSMSGVGLKKKKVLLLSDQCGRLKLRCVLRGQLQSSRKNGCRSVLKILSQFSDIKHLSAVAFETTEVCMCVCLTSEAPTELRLPRCELEAVSGLTQSYLGVCYE